jgi:hypothetical protein
MVQDSVRLYQEARRATDINLEYWASFLTEQMWKVMMSLRKHRNQVVYGASTEEQATILLDNLKQNSITLHLKEIPPLY